MAQLYSQDENTATFQMPDGSFMPVAKNALDPEYLNSLTASAEPNSSPAAPPSLIDPDRMKAYQDMQLGNQQSAELATGLQGQNVRSVWNPISPEASELSKLQSDVKKSDEEKASALAAANYGHENDTKRMADLKQLNDFRATQNLPPLPVPIDLQTGLMKNTSSDQQSSVPEIKKASDETPGTSGTSGQPTAAKGKQGLDLLQSGFDQQRTAAAAGAKVGVEKANEMFAYNKQLQKEAEAYQIAQADKYKQQAETVKVQQDKYQDLAKKFNETSIKDPWANMETGNKIMAAISIGLGAFAGGLNGTGKNGAMDIINDAINRDIQVQKANLEKQKGGVEMQGNMVQQTRQAIGDQNQSDLALHGLYLEKVKQDINALASKYDAPQIQANRDNLLGQINVQQAQLKQQFTSGAIDLAQKAYTYQHPQMTPEQAKNYSSGQTLIQSADEVIKNQNNPSRLGKLFNTEAQGKVDLLNAKIYEALHSKPPSGPEYEAWKSSPEAVKSSDTNKPELLIQKAEELKREGRMRILGAGRVAATIPQNEVK